LKPQGWDKNDPFNNMGPIDNSLETGQSVSTNPFICLQNENMFANSQNPGIHFVEPHYVEGYFRQDGTYVDGYWRDGDGNTDIDLTIEDGGGYIRTNPDGDPTNNLGF
jgi:Protein of unknown function (DUF3892)